MTPSRAFDRPLETALGRGFAGELAAHPGESALYVLESGLDAFAARALLIDAAERAIDVQYYILHDDVTGRVLLSRLLAAADRGVRVRLLVDDLGSPGLDELLSAAHAHPNLEAALWNPLARGPLPGLARALDLVAHPVRLNHRMHNKMLAVDGVAAVVGGRNLGDEYFDASPDVNFADLDLLAAGPVLTELGESFDRYWNSPFVVPVDAWKRLRGGPDDARALTAELAAFETSRSGTPYAERLRESRLVTQFQAGDVPRVWAPVHVFADLPEKAVARGDAVADTLLARQLRPVFEAARSRLDIVSPYFVPRETGARFLGGLAGRGVRVRILTNSLAATDVPAVHAGYSRYRRALLEADIELYELKRTGETFREASRAGLFGSSAASLHAKTYLVDGEKVFVGSLNLDPRSVELNTELGLLVESEELARRYQAGFERMAAPEVSWRVRLVEGALRWEGREAGAPERFETDPETGAWKRFRVRLLALLPIEGQL